MQILMRLSIGDDITTSNPRSSAIAGSVKHQGHIKASGYLFRALTGTVPERDYFSLCSAMQQFELRPISRSQGRYPEFACHSVPSRSYTKR